MLFFIVSGTLGGLANALLWSRRWLDLAGFTFWRSIALGAIAGYLYYLMYTEWSLPDSVVAFVFGYAFKDAIEGLVARVLGRGLKTNSL